MKNLIILMFATALLSGCTVNGVFFKKKEKPVDPIVADHEVIIRNASDGEVIKHYLFKPVQKAKATIVVLQDYGSPVSDIYQNSQPLVAAGYQVLMMEYRAIGNSEFEVPHLKIVSDTVNAIDYLTSRSDEKHLPILILGQGYGSQPAIYAAHIKHATVDGLVLEGAFTSFSDKAKYSADNFVEELISKIVPNVYSGIDIIEHVRLPTLIVHSADDHVVPLTMGERLHKASGDANVEFWQINGRHLYGLTQQPEQYVQKIQQLLKLSPGTK